MQDGGWINVSEDQKGVMVVAGCVCVRVCVCVVAGLESAIKMS